MDAKSEDLRAQISHVKNYAKKFENELHEENLKIKELKENKNYD
ncbi:MAG: hypothetical protein PHW82_16480 [Bacteroidales bacterium]|nr:hypothetical protein [Bacteroidales bacterium]